MKRNKRKPLLWIVVGGIFLCVGIFITIPLVIMNVMLDMHINYSKTWEAKDFGLDATHFFVKTEDGLNISTYEIAVDSPKAVIINLNIRMK